MTPTHDVLAWNPLAAALMVDFGEVPERERSFVRLLFTDPRMQSLYPEWEELARACGAGLSFRAGAARARGLGCGAHQHGSLTRRSSSGARRRARTARTGR
jgi:hypothetical protein